MITIFTTSQAEYNMALKLSDYLNNNLNNTETSIMVNSPHESYGVISWSVDDAFDALEDNGVDTGELSEDLIVNCIAELDLFKCVEDATIVCGNEMLRENVDDLIDLLNKKTGGCIVYKNNVEDETASEVSGCGSRGAIR